jgi:intracellular sulfur oxidation DsrE/DsrF family protein
MSQLTRKHFNELTENNENLNHNLKLYIKLVKNLQDENEKLKIEILKLNHKISKLENDENNKLGLLSNLEHLIKEYRDD